MTKVGIELEFITAVSRAGITDMVNAALRQYGMHCRDTGRYLSSEYPENLWQLKTDCSLRTTGVQLNGIELVSPPMVWNNASRAVVRAVCDVLSTVGGINSSCGMHVHVDCREWTPLEYARVCNRYARYETQFDTLVGPSRRESRNHFCASVPRLAHLMPRETLQRTISEAASLAGRAKVNPGAWARNHATIEFRHFGGTLQAFKACGNVDLLVEFVEASRTLAQAASNAAQAAAPAPVRTRTPRPGSKLAHMVALCSREGGATSSEIESRLGVVDHTVRGYASKLRNEYGYAIETVTVSTAGALAYRIIGRRTVQAAPAAPAPVQGITDSGWLHGISEASRRYVASRQRALGTAPVQAAAAE